MFNFFQAIWFLFFAAWVAGFAVVAYYKNEVRWLIVPGVISALGLFTALFNTSDAYSVRDGTWGTYEDSQCYQWHSEQQSCLDDLPKQRQYIEDHTVMNQQLEVKFFPTLFSFFGAWVAWVNYVLLASILVAGLVVGSLWLLMRRFPREEKE